MNYRYPEMTNGHPKHKLYSKRAPTIFWLHQNSGAQDIFCMSVRNKQIFFRIGVKVCKFAFLYIFFSS